MTPQRKRPQPPASKVEHSPNMDSRGVAAVMDVLGFKAARKVHGAARLVESVRRFRRHLESTGKHERLFGLGAPTTATISDTVIMARQADEVIASDEVVPIGATLLQIVAAASTLMTTAAAGRPPLAFRGCIAAGPLVVASDAIFVGDAIDEAAELAEQALAAVVWLAPSASAVLPKDKTTLLLLEWPVRLHERGELTAKVVNPFWLGAAMAPNVQDADREIQSVVRPFLLSPFNSNAIDVVQKRQNTEAFLDYAAARTIANWDEIQADAFPEGRSNG